MQRGWVKIRAIGPNQRVDFGVDAHLVEEVQIAQRPVDATRQHWQKMDGLFCPVCKAHAQGVRRDDFKILNAMEG